MKKARIKNNFNKEKMMPTEEYSSKTMLLIILILIIVFVIFYFITGLIINNKKQDNNHGVVQVDDTKITISNMLNQDEDEYYVLATIKGDQLSNMNYIELYNKYISEYKKGDNLYKFYNIDLNDAFNKSYVSNEENITDDLTNLKIKEDTLFKISSGKIESYYTGNKNIIKKLSNL